MTTVSPVSSTPTATETAAKSSVGDLDYNAFLKLLIAQMKNQDPTKPMDSTAFMAQLATFSQVEQSVSTNTKLDSLLDRLGAHDRPTPSSAAPSHRPTARSAAWSRR